MLRRCTAGGLLAVCVFSGCTQVPITGRSSINFMAHDRVARMGEQSFQELKLALGEVRDPALVQKLQRVVDRLTPPVMADMPDVSWDLAVLDQPRMFNALSTPDGHIAITSGLMRALENDDQLAAVIGHEMAHLVARHLDEQMSRMTLATGGPAAMMVGVPTLGIGSSLLTLSFGREQELEADRMGMIYMARAGYNPAAARRVFEIMSNERKATGKRMPGGMLSTHPAYPERLQQIDYRLPEAQMEYDTATGGAPPKRKR